jgi:hypothetical protein
LPFAVNVNILRFPRDSAVQIVTVLKVPVLIPVEAPTVALYREDVRDVLPRKINLCFNNLGDHASLTTSHHDGTS